MRSGTRSGLLAVLLLALPCPGTGGAPPTAGAPPVREAFDEEYRGADATGPHVIALWSFDVKNPWADASGRGHDLTPQGAEARPDGRFGGGLASFRGWPKEDRRHAALARDHPALSPPGAFTLEIWLAAGPELAGYPESFLLDKKYVAHDDWQLVLSAASPQGLRRVTANLGFGDVSVAFVSGEAEFAAGVWRHLAFTYDGAGRGRFYLDGEAFGGTDAPGRWGVHPGSHPLSIGDRIGSYYHGFPGRIDQVRITAGVREFRRLSVALLADRRVYVRREAAPPLIVRVTNHDREPAGGATLGLALEGRPGARVRLPRLAPGASHDASFDLDTGLRPGDYRLAAEVSVGGSRPFRSAESWPVTIVPRPLPNPFPVVMWGVNSPERVLAEMDRLLSIGFTHCLGIPCDYARVFEAGRPVEPGTPERLDATRRMLDEALRRGLCVTASLSPGSWARGRPELLRVDRTGKPGPGRPDVCALFPGLAVFCRNVGASVAGAFGRFPAFDSALLHTEVRDAAGPCFHPHDREALRKATGLPDIPERVAGKEGVAWKSLPGFPASRVVPDDDPLLTYYRWYWKEGDGWPGLNTALAEGLRTAGREDFWTFTDPAVRVASVYGSGGDVDVLSQWTYSYPDPIRIGTATDELMAMAAGARRPQRVMKMTQVIWYRSQTAPLSDASRRRGEERGPWEDTEPDAAFLTIAPMHLREAFWEKVSRPIRGIMYHGFEALVPTASTGAYRHTHPETQHELARLVREVLRPLGPTLAQVPDPPADVLFLESFASQVFARRGTWGWGGSWAGDACLVLRWAGLQPAVVYDETVLSGGLDGAKLLVLADCDVLTEGVVERIRTFREAGGLVAGDDRLCPAVRPDILLAPHVRAGNARADKAALLSRAARLRADLAGRYERFADSSEPEVVLRRRRAGTADYVFAVNDRREPGEYVGSYGLVMERGLPASATVSLARPAGFAYDLVAGREVPVRAAGGRIELDVALDPGDGRVFLVTARPIHAVKVEAPGSARAGTVVTVDVTVADPSGAPVDAVVPVRLAVADPDGRPAEAAGVYGAAGGRLRVRLDLAENETRGVFTIRATELASRREGVAWLRVE